MVYIAEDVGEMSKCQNSFLAVLTDIRGQRTEPRLIKFEFDEAIKNWKITGENKRAPPE